MRSSIIALLAGSVVALASPAIRVAVTVDDGAGTGSLSQNVLTADPIDLLPFNFLLQVPNQDLFVSPKSSELGQPFVLNPRTGSSLESFFLRRGNLFSISSNGPPLVVFTNNDSPPAVVFGSPEGGDGLRLLYVAAFPPDYGGPLELKQFDPNSGNDIVQPCKILMHSLGNTHC